MAVMGTVCMEVTKITGGRQLAGHIRPAAAKNSVLPLLAATLLCAEGCTLYNVPRLRDVDTSLALLAGVGARAVWQGGNIETRPTGCIMGEVPRAQAAAMRGSIFYLAPLLLRAGAVRLPLPGGCCLGPRPVDIHLNGLRAMGAEAEVQDNAVTLRRFGALKGADFTLRLPSVGATLTLLMAGCCAKGTTTLRGAACEPEIVDTADFLRAAGADVTGDGTPVIRVRGSDGAPLRGAAHAALPDRIAAATYAAAAAIAGGEICIDGCRPGHLAAFLDFLRAAGCEVTAGEGSITILRDPARPLRGGAALQTAAYPGFATDAAPLAAAVLLGAQGRSSVYDALFQSRFACAEGFCALGAQVWVRGQRLYIEGGAAMHGARLAAPDLRGGAALLAAALGAQGESLLYDTGHLRRGYEHLAADLAALGAQCRVKYV